MPELKKQSQSKIPVPGSKGSEAKGGPTKMKVRGVPDFTKLHQQWNTKLEKGKAYTKKPCTQVHEFGITHSGTKFKRAETSHVNDLAIAHRVSQKKTDGSAKSKHDVKFKPDSRALDSIVSHRGLTKTTGRATVAGISCHSATRKPMRTRKSPMIAITEEDSSSQKVAGVPGVAARKSHEFKVPCSLTKSKQQQGVEFETDQKALQSILDHTGVAMVTAPGATPSIGAAQRQTIAGNATPLGLRQARLTMSTRKSIYYTGKQGDCAAPTNVYSEQARRVISRVTLGGAGEQSPSMYERAMPLERVPQHGAYSPFSRPVAFKQMGSIYHKYVYPNEVVAASDKNKENLALPKTPSTMQKAQRLARPGAATCPPAARLAVTSEKPEQKWKDMLGPRTLEGVPSASPMEQPLARVLDFENEDPITVPSGTECTNEGAIQEEMDHLKHIEDLEKELLADIANMETTPGTNHHSPYFPLPTLGSDLGVPSEGQRSPASRTTTPKQDKPAVTSASKFFATPSLEAIKPRIQIWKDSENSSTRKIHLDIATERKPSPLKVLSPNIQIDTAKSPRSPKRRSKQLIQAYNLAEPETRGAKTVHFAVKENVSPAVKEDAPSHDWHNCTIEDLNQTLSESVVQFEQLESKADHLLRGVGQPQQQPMSSEKILKQLEAIQRKQQKLVKLQETLQQQLMQQLNGNIKKDGPKHNTLESQPRKSTEKVKPLRKEDPVSEQSSRKSRSPMVTVEQQVQDAPDTEENLGDSMPPPRIPPAAWEVVKDDSQKEKPLKIKKPFDCTMVVKVECGEEESKNKTTDATVPTKSAFSRRSGIGFVLPQRGSEDGGELNQTNTGKPTTKVSLHTATCVTPKVQVNQRPPISTPTTPIFSPTLAGTSQIVQGFAHEFHHFYRSSSIERMAFPPARNLLEPTPVNRPRSSLSIDGCSSNESSPLDLSLKKLQDPSPLNIHWGNHDPTQTPVNTNNNCGCRDSTTPCTCSSFPTRSVNSDIHHKPSPQKSFRSSVITTAAQKFYEALLDEEVSLYACRLHPRVGVNEGQKGRCDNPVAVLLAEGDEQHFVPIRLLTTPSAPVTGSAFSAFRGS